MHTGITTYASKLDYNALIMHFYVLFQYSHPSKIGDHALIICNHPPLNMGDHALLHKTGQVFN